MLEILWVNFWQRIGHTNIYCPGWSVVTCIKREMVRLATTSPRLEFVVIFFVLLITINILIVINSLKSRLSWSSCTSPSPPHPSPPPWHPPGWRQRRGEQKSAQLQEKITDLRFISVEKGNEPHFSLRTLKLRLLIMTAIVLLMA